MSRITLNETPLGETFAIDANKPADIKIIKQGNPVILSIKTDTATVSASQISGQQGQDSENLEAEFST